MAECILNLEDVKINGRTNYTFYASDDFVIYKNKNNINIDQTGGETIVSTDCPKQYKNYSLIDNSGEVIILFAGKTLLRFDKDFRIVATSDLPVDRVGRCVTPIHSIAPNKIVFGAYSNNRFHFVNYDIIEKQRDCQTCSWEVSQINNTVLVGNNLYALFDNSYMVCCDMSTAETLWTRFEAGKIDQDILIYNDRLLYACHGLIKIVRNKESETIRIPLARPSSARAIIGDLLFYTANDRKNLCCFDLLKKELVWEITGTAEIEQTVTLKGSVKGQIQDLMMLKMGDNLAIVNLSTGRMHSYFKSNNVQNIRKTGSSLLVQKLMDRTDIIGA